MHKMRIEVKTQFEGLHCWPEAPDGVKFLRNTHRHMFHVVLRIPVTHGDRDLEFVMVKRALDGHLQERFFHIEDGAALLGRASCEDIASEIISWVHITYDRYGVEVGVFEDGENGCWVEDNDGVR